MKRVDGPRMTLGVKDCAYLGSSCAGLYVGRQVCADTCLRVILSTCRHMCSRDRAEIMPFAAAA